MNMDTFFHDTRAVFRDLRSYLSNQQGKIILVWTKDGGHFHVTPYRSIQSLRDSPNILLKRIIYDRLIRTNPLSSRVTFIFVWEIETGAIFTVLSDVSYKCYPSRLPLDTIWFQPLSTASLDSGTTSRNL